MLVLNENKVGNQDMGERLKSMESAMATKADLERVETLIRGDLEQIHLRLDNIAKSLADRLGELEAEVSRLRSLAHKLRGAAYRAQYRRDRRTGPPGRR